MPRKSKINIFNVMSLDELNEALKSKKHERRYYERLVAMKLIAEGHSHKKTANILQIGYRTVYRWAKTCEEFGLEGLKPDFNGGKPSSFTKEDRVKFEKILDEGEYTMSDAQNILRNDFDLDFTLPYVCKLVRELGFDYSLFQTGEDGEILKKTLIKLK